VTGSEQLPAQIAPGAMLLMGCIAIAIAAAMMWLAAMIVNIKDATWGRALMAAVGLSIITAAAGAALNRTTANGMIVVAAVGVPLAIVAIKLIYRTTLLKAVGVLVLNVMMQMIIYSLYIRAAMRSGLPGAAS